MMISKQPWSNVMIIHFQQNAKQLGLYLINCIIVPKDNGMKLRI